MVHVVTDEEVAEYRLIRMRETFLEAHITPWENLTEYAKAMWRKRYTNNW